VLHHLVMLTLEQSASTEQRDAIVAGLRALPGQVPGLRSIDVRTDEGLAEGNAEIFFRMTFQDEQAWRAYTPHPAHTALAEDHILPVLRVKTALQHRD
jgi:hypothetical protein